jgi:hypothetical protein
MNNERTSRRPEVELLITEALAMELLILVCCATARVCQASRITDTIIPTRPPIVATSVSILTLWRNNRSRPRRTTYSADSTTTDHAAGSSRGGADRTGVAAWKSGGVLCSSKMQQRHRASPAAADPHGPAGLGHRPPATALPPDGKERSTIRRHQERAARLPCLLIPRRCSGVALLWQRPRVAWQRSYALLGTRRTR